MLRRSARLGLITVGASLIGACGGGGATNQNSGTGGFTFGVGGFADTGGDNGSGGDGMSASGGGTFGNTGGGGGSFATGGGGGGGLVVIGGGGTPSAGGAGGESSLDGGSGGSADASTGEGGVGGQGGTGGQGGSVGAGGGSGGTGTGGVADVDAGSSVCGDHVVEGKEACDTAGDSKTCDSDCTLVKCGDKHVNPVAGEQCDDGNNKNGDGCDLNCQIENQCSTPRVIALTPNGSALSGSISDTTSDGISLIHDAPCGGGDVGQGPDAIFSFTLDRTRSVTVNLSASFDGILRAYTTACAPSAGLKDLAGSACANAGVGTETMSFSNLAAGTYYVAVDGAAAGDKGTYTIGVDAVCNGIDQVRLVELGIGTTDYVVLRNMSDCPSNLAGTKLFFNDSVATDLTTALPNVTLQPGEQLKVQENLVGTVPGVIDAGGSIPFQYDRGGSVLFCKSDCSVAANVVDLVSFADGDPNPPIQPPPDPPAPLAFSFPLKGIDASNQDTKSWVRVASTAKPTFTGGDWCLGTPNIPFGIRLEEVFVGEPDYFTVKNHADCGVKLAGFSVRASTEGVATPVDGALGAITLGSGATVYIAEAPVNGDIAIGSIANTGALAGNVQLCFGSCANSGTTIDVVAWNGTSSSFPALPSSITFTPDGLASITIANQSTNSYLRNAVSGNDPRFFASDWKIGAKTR